MQKRYLIGIAGGSGSGKTTFIEGLRKHFSEEQLCVLSQDDYYRPKEEQELDEEGVNNFDRPASLYRTEFAQDVQTLLSGEQISRKEYVFNNDAAAAEMLYFNPAPVIIVEGLFVFHYEEIWDLLDLKLFIHAKENLKVIRRIKRDRVERNYPLDDVLYRYQAHVLPAFEKYILPYKEEVDVIINNNENFNVGLTVMQGYIEHLLKN